MAFWTRRARKIEVTDRVQIVQADGNQSQWLNEKGTLVILIDDTKCFVKLDSGDMAEVDISQLKKL